ncbi:MAG: phosphoribosylamine--glycine ligase [Candidatus Omnitrophica bacterium]|jgi:phosphoribosylamine--glycine ligase|nr:phosphoribosylamine--glycine ligase [Candidatus Omnitrophota bacterium]MDD5661406.1 phosphoribosylamine--glycine ligase [Candidatus Omnitrophota bacterium]
MRILVVGSGGREHALVWKIAQSKLVDKVFCAPGNGGIAGLAECIDIKADDVFGLLGFARKERIDLTVVGPEVALSLGIVDEFEKSGLKIFGPNIKAANLEASKVFSKELMAKYKVPTAEFKVFNSPEEAKKYIDEIGVPCVVKASGLASGKGVVVAGTIEEAKNAVTSMMQAKIFGEAGVQIVIEECLSGEEASILVITDSKDVVTLVTSQDHKRVFDNDEGPNTGGMGAYSPAPIVTPDILEEIKQKIIYRAIDGLVQEGIGYRGVLYAGVMLTKDGPKALEFNVRFGDPETEVILPRLKSDLVEVMLAASEGRLSKIGSLEWDSRACVCVVCASAGYPGNYPKDKEITGLDQAGRMPDVVIFHAGTRQMENTILTNGGRVLDVTALGATIKDAINKTYAAVEKINFEGMHYRKDIAKKALK